MLEWAERWIALGDTPEPAYRALMVAHGAAGESSQVALAYERCVEALRNELSVEPSTETRALYEKSVHGETTTRAIVAPLPSILVQPVRHRDVSLYAILKVQPGCSNIWETSMPPYSATSVTFCARAPKNFAGTKWTRRGTRSFSRSFAPPTQWRLQRKRNSELWPRTTGPKAQRYAVRMGLHTGEPMLARTGYVGMDVHRAARIGAAGHGGQVLMSRITRDLVENDLPAGHALDRIWVSTNSKTSVTPSTLCN